MIDKDKLRELAADPNAKTKDIFKGLGFNNYATFAYQLNKDPDAKRVFEETRSAAKINGGGGVKASAKKPRRRSQKRAAKRSAPPRKSNAKGNISDELLRKIRHEFEHIALYEAISDHFEELRQELAEA